MDIVEAKWECKRILNKSLDNGKFIKKEFEWVVKHILKSNLLLFKHYSLIKSNMDYLFDSCNYLLSMDFFVNDKILILWIARAINHEIMENKVIYDDLRWYLKYKQQEMKKSNNKYFHKLYERTLIRCDDGCFDEYLPISTRGISDKYSEFEKEVSELNKHYIGMSKYHLNEEEKNNIKEFEFCKIHEIQLLQEIKNVVSKYHEVKDKISDTYITRMNELLYVIRNFENIVIWCNNEFNFNTFVEDIRYNRNSLYQLMKKDVFNYNVNDDFFVIDKDENGEVIEVNSINDILSVIYVDVPKWIKYMQSHDIKTLSEMYIDENYFKMEC